MPDESRLLAAINHRDANGAASGKMRRRGLKGKMLAPPMGRFAGSVRPYLIITRSLPLRPNTSGVYISSALAGGTTNSPGVVALAI